MFRARTSSGRKPIVVWHRRYFFLNWTRTGFVNFFLNREKNSQRKIHWEESYQTIIFLLYLCVFCEWTICVANISPKIFPRVSMRRASKQHRQGTDQVESSLTSGLNRISIVVGSGKITSEKFDGNIRFYVPFSKLVWRSLSNFYRFFCAAAWDLRRFAAVVLVAIPVAGNQTGLHVKWFFLYYAIFLRFDW